MLACLRATGPWDLVAPCRGSAPGVQPPRAMARCSPVVEGSLAPAADLQARAACQRRANVRLGAVRGCERAGALGYLCSRAVTPPSAPATVGAVRGRDRSRLGAAIGLWAAFSWLEEVQRDHDALCVHAANPHSLPIEQEMPCQDEGAEYAAVAVTS